MSPELAIKKEGGLRVSGRPPNGAAGTPLVSVITVVLNGEGSLSHTIDSVLEQTFQNREYIIVDGGSTDATLDILRGYGVQVDYWVSEPDHGVYDAMNKAIGLSRGTWLIFINAGDMLDDEKTLEKTIQQLSDDVDLVYSDTKFFGTRERLIRCERESMRIIHQSLLYRKSLHAEKGGFLVFKGVTISDYIFFNLVADRRWKKVHHVIARCDDRGISSHSRTWYQKLAVDLIFQTKSTSSVALLLLLYPFYKILKTAYWRARPNTGGKR